MYSAAPCCYKYFSVLSLKCEVIWILYIIDFQYTCLYPQDFECDVSVEDDNRQEWIFTLYDFDNSGKVTKEVCMFSLSLLSVNFYLRS